MNSGNGKHDSLVDRIFERLNTTEKFVVLDKEHEYGHKGRRADIYAETKSGQKRYYEIKASFHSASCARAKAQAKAFYRCFGEESTAFILITYNGVYRLRPDEVRDV